MNRRLVGIALIAVGVALTVWGYGVYDSAGSQISRALDGSAPMRAWVGMVVGVVCVGAGILRLK